MVQADGGVRVWAGTCLPPAVWAQVNQRRGILGQDVPGMPLCGSGSRPAEKGIARGWGGCLDSLRTLQPGRPGCSHQVGWGGHTRWVHTQGGGHTGQGRHTGQGALTRQGALTGQDGHTGWGEHTRTGAHETAATPEKRKAFRISV